MTIQAGLQSMKLQELKTKKPNELLEFAEELGQNVRCDRWYGANAQPTRDIPLTVIQATTRLRDVDENLSRVIEQTLAGLGRNH